MWWCLRRAPTTSAIPSKVEPSMTAAAEPMTTGDRWTPSRRTSSPVSCVGSAGRKETNERSELALAGHCSHPDPRAVHAAWSPDQDHLERTNQWLQEHGRSRTVP